MSFLSKYYVRRHIIFEILKSLSFIKLFVLFISWISFLFKSTKSGKIPFALTLHLTYKCNFSCIMCQKSSLDPTVYSLNLPEMSYAGLCKLLKENSTHIIYINLHGGEPLLYSNIKQLINLLNEINIKYSLITNGSLFTQEISRSLIKNCLEISFSIDSADKNKFAKIRKGGDLDIIEHNIEMLNKLKEGYKKITPFLRLTATVFNFNIDDLKGLVDFAKRNNFKEITLQEGTFYNTPEIKEKDFIKNNLLIVKKAVKGLREYADKQGVLLNHNSPVFDPEQHKKQIPSKPKKHKRCFYYYHYINITPTLDVSICNISDPIENLDGNSLQDIWNGKDSNMMKNRILLSRNEYPETCRYCRHYDSNPHTSYVEFQKSNHYWEIKN